MIRLYAAPRTRAVRVVWLLEELALPYELVQVDFQPTTSRFFIQNTPTGKIPTLEDDDMVMCESGAIIEYLLERYGEGRLAPAIGTPARGPYLQWLHFAESTAFAPLGVVIWLTVYRADADRHPELVRDAVARARLALEQVAAAVEQRSYLSGDEFTAADIMMGFTLLAAQTLQLVAHDSALESYLSRITSRPAFAATRARLPF